MSHVAHHHHHHDRPPASVRDHLTSPVTRTVLRVQSRITALTREYLADHGFVELLPPILGPVTDPGTRGSKQIDVDYYGHRYKLMASAILYKQVSLLGFDRIFYVAPNVRLEPPETASTGRHLVEFHQIDVEIRDGDRDAAASVAEGLVTYLAGEVVRRMPAELELLGRDPDAFAELQQGPFGRMTHAEAVATLAALGQAQSADTEINWQAEKVLSTKASRPFFVLDYPKGSRGFYDREDPSHPGRLTNFDLLAPEGYGELASGSEREHDYPRLVTRMRESGENPAKYRWYLDVAREGLPASAGFGLGLERLTRYVTGRSAVWETVAFPKIAGVPSP